MELIFILDCKSLSFTTWLTRVCASPTWATRNTMYLLRAMPVAGAVAVAGEPRSRRMERETTF